MKYIREADHKLSADIRKRIKRLPYWSLFRYATWFDILLIIIGVVSAVIASVCPCWELYR